MIRLPAFLTSLLCLVMPLFGGEALRWKKLPPLPERLGVAAPFAGVSGVSGDALIVAGGANFPHGMPWQGGRKVWHDTVWLLDRPGGKWRVVGKLPRPLAYGVSVTHHDSLICVGGSDATRHYADAFRLTWKEGVLETAPLPPLPIALSGAAYALMGDVLYVACGSEEPGEKSATNRAFTIDLSAKALAWQEIEPLPARARILATGAAHRGIFYLFGGAALEPGAEGTMARSYLREAWSYRPKVGWRKLANMPRPCVAPPGPAPVVGNVILLIAGDDGSRVGFKPIEKHPGFPSAILSYDPARDYWSTPGRTPAPRATVPCVAWRDLFVIPSGEVRPGVRSPEVWSFKPVR